MVTSIPLVRLGAAWAAYEAFHFHGLAPRTRVEYRCYVKRALAELPPMLNLEALLRWRSAQLVGMHGFDVVYVNQHFAALRTVTNRAADATSDLELAALVRLVRPWREEVPTPRCPPPDFMRRSLLAADNPAEHAWLRLAGWSGLRYGELLGLMPHDYDRAYGVLRVVRQRRSPHRKNYQAHSVRVDSASLRTSLEWMIDHHAELGPQDAHRRAKLEPFLFPWSLPHCEAFLRRVKASFGADRDKYLPEGCGWHSWRHWGATELARDGRSVLQIQEWLGHKDPATAARYVAFVRGETGASVSTLEARTAEAVV